MVKDQKLSEEDQQRIQEEINRKLEQEEDWEETYGHLFDDQDGKSKFAGGTLGGQQQRMETNKDYERSKDRPEVDIKIKKK